MLVNTGLVPVINLRDYTLSVTPQDGYLKIDGEYYISSNLNIPDNLIELQHKLPSQLVDKVFLKTTGRSCNSSDVNLKCSIYKSSSFIDVKNDRTLNNVRNKASSLLLETNFLMNRQVRHNLIHHNVNWSVGINLLKNQIVKNGFKLHLPAISYNFLSRADINKSSEHFTLDLIKSVNIKSDGSENYKYQKIGIYLSKWSDIISGSPLLSVWEIPEKINEKTSLKIKNLTGKLVFRELISDSYTTIDLKPFIWRNNPNNESLLELTQEGKWPSFWKINDLHNAEMDIVFSLSKNDWTNVVQLKTGLSYMKQDWSKKGNSVFIDPYDPLFRTFRIDQTWIVEKM